MNYLRLIMRVVRVANTLRAVVDAFIDFVRIVQASGIPERATELLDFMTERLADINDQLGDKKRAQRLRDFIQ